ncbi:MAG: hypothetical protein B6I37_08065 [Desulfobacteraceae bacterium 4572_35.2]|nr:MAG: hypothetical protein B6I37_08065 [Desulfobacteraceae bacterium 4572_35.2]
MGKARYKICTKTIYQTNSKKGLYMYSKKYFFKSLTVLLFFLLILNCALACADSRNRTPYKLRASIMYIVPEENMVNVAEEEIILKFHMEQGIKKWDTRVIDTDGNSVDILKLKSRDRVLVSGWNDGNKIVADEIILIESHKQ